MRYQAALFLLLSFLPISVSANVVSDDKIKMHTDTMVRDLTCGITTEFAIRAVNLFVAQMNVIEPDSEDKRWVTKSMVDMLNGFKIDLAYQVEELLKAGVTKSVIDKLVEETSDKVHEQHLMIYMRSIDVEEAKSGIASVIAQQGSCAEWYAKEVLPRLRDRKGEIDG